jgi:glycogen synthase
MKILMTTDTVGGVWTYTIDLARELARAGHETVIAAMGGFLTRRQRSEVAALEGVTLYDSRYKLEWMSNCWEDVDTAGHWLLEIERKFRPDVVHLNGYAHGSLHWRSRVLVVGHSCVLSWWHAVRGTEAPAEWDEYRARIRKGINAADYVVGPSAAMLAEMQRYYGVEPPSTVIPNGRSAARFYPREKRPYVMTIGRVWDEAKNLATVAKAAPAIQWPVYVAGQNSHPDHGGAYVPANVRHLGSVHCDNLAVWLGGAAIYALPARYEPFGLSVLEAALSGCALVLSDIPSFLENWEGAAEFVSPDDPEALATAVNRLIDDSSARDNLTRKARMRAMQFTPARMAAEYIRIYQELAAPRATEAASA